MDDDASADKKGGNKKNKNKGLSKSAKRKLEEKKRQEAAAEKKALQDELMDIEVRRRGDADMRAVLLPSPTPLVPRGTSFPFSCKIS